MFAKSTVAVALLASFVAAQSNSTIDPNTVNPSLRSQWCLGQQNTCGTLCSGEFTNNLCDAATLNFTCTCQSNNSAPGLQYYQETMPTFICEQVFQNCIAAGENDAAAQAVCTKNEKANCGHLSPENFTAVAVSSSSSAASTPTGTSASSPSGTSAAATTSSSKAAAATMVAGQSFGTGAIAMGVVAAFGYML